MSCDDLCGFGGLPCGGPGCTSPCRVYAALRSDGPLDHTITAPRRVELVDCESGRVVLDLPSDLQARIVAAASDAGMGVAEWMELVLAERGRA